MPNNVPDNNVGEMTDNEVIKALECCMNEESKLFNCVGCAFMECKMGQKRECTYYMLKSALDLINRQKSDLIKKDKELLEALKNSAVNKTKVIDYEKEINRLKSELFEKTEQLETAKADIKKLTSGKCVYLSDDETTEYCVEGPCPIYKTEAEIKAEAYKEFVERLEERASKGFWETDSYIGLEQINDILKELVGDK